MLTSDSKSQALSVFLEETLEDTEAVVIVVQLLSRVQLFATSWTAVCQAPLSFIVSIHFTI